MYVAPVTIATIVEGDGEKTALPKLLYRLASELSIAELRVPPPHRINRGKLLAPKGIEQAVSAGAKRVGESGGILVLLDADDDCPARLAPILLERAQGARSDVPVCVVLAKREFEAWYLAAAPSLAGIHGFPADLSMPTAPEQVRGAKEWLSRHRTSGRPYKPTVDQAALASVFDMTNARLNSPSFDKFCRDVKALLMSRPSSSMDR